MRVAGRAIRRRGSIQSASRPSPSKLSALIPVFMPSIRDVNDPRRSSDGGMDDRGARPSPTCRAGRRAAVGAPASPSAAARGPVDRRASVCGSSLWTVASRASWRRAGRSGRQPPRPRPSLHGSNAITAEHALVRWPTRARGVEPFPYPGGGGIRPPAPFPPIARFGRHSSASEAVGLGGPRSDSWAKRSR